MLDNWYLYYYLQHLKPEFERISNGSTIKTIGLPYFRQLTVPLPSIGQQRAVSTALRDADSLIATLQRLVVKKHAVNQGMMQQLLTGRTRLSGFDEPWRLMRFGNLGSFLKGRGVKRDDVRESGSGVPCIRYGELYTDFDDYTATTRSFVTREIAATALPLRSGDLLFAGSGETRQEIGTCVAYVGATDAVAGGDIVVLRGGNGSFNPVYLATLANTPHVANQKARAGQGDAVVHISSRALAAIQIEIPSTAEQDAIAAVIIDADREIAALRSRLEKARSIKLGMMQQLLTGRIRLP